MSSRIERFETLVRQQPGNELFRFSLAQALIAAGRGSDAISHLEACAAQKADWMMPRILLGKELLAAGQTARARPVLEAALALAVSQNHEDPERELRELLR